MQRYRVKPGQEVDLSQWDPEDNSGFSGDKEEGQARMLELNDQLEELQELMYAEHKHRLLVVLQARDTGGKDGVIRHVFDGVNPIGVRVASFKAPSPEELDHDYLWRIHRHTPGRGEMVIFNRSHYEDVLVVRVHEYVSERVWQKRYQQINDFERMLAEEGTTILKFYLHIDKQEQKKRLEERLHDPRKRWKFNVGDLKERELWEQYTRAYEDVLSQTSTEWAPWHIIPANDKWYRNLVIAHVMVDTMKALKMEYPKPKEDLDGVEVR